VLVGRDLKHIAVELGLDDRLQIVVSDNLDRIIFLRRYFYLKNAADIDCFKIGQVAFVRDDVALT
jgi:hypothetical protein